MAISRVKTWSNNEILTHTDLNSEFDNILNNALSLVSPWTANMAAGGFILTGLGLGSVSNPTVQFTGDANTGVYSSAANTLDLATDGVQAASFGASFVLRAAPEDSRTATVDVAGIIESTTSGAPAAGIGTGLQFNAESADENPSVFGSINFTATDIGAGSEDTDFVVLARTAGAAAAEIGRMTSLGAFRPGANAPATPVGNSLYRNSLVKAWVNVSGGANPVIDGDFNVSSISDGGPGIFTVNMVTAVDADGAAVAQCDISGGAVDFTSSVASVGVSSFIVFIITASTGVSVDPPTGFMAIYGG